MLIKQKIFTLSYFLNILGYNDIEKASIFLLILGTYTTDDNISTAINKTIVSYHNITRKKTESMNMALTIEHLVDTGSLIKQ